MTGKILRSEVIKRVTMRIKLDYPPGAYILSLNLHNKTIQRKVMIE